MGRRKQTQYIKGTAQHRRTEGDYMAVLLDTVTLNDWRSVVNGALQAAKAGDPQARNWLAQYLIGKPEGKAPTPMNIVINQLSGADPVVENLAKPAINQALYPSGHTNEDFKAHIRSLVASELHEKVKPLETTETPASISLGDDSESKNVVNQGLTSLMVSINLGGKVEYGRIWQRQARQQKNHGRYVGLGYPQNCKSRVPEAGAVFKLAMVTQR